ncbi:hypothetical protein F3Y22_tig00111848pilonHSYRG00079 [Hibiscus syriacus]|uniref:Uncharacterized protein n=1 Tax=Hibiscus syriacus TaxID=106335 RepID=A0A6A2XA96_HIBSY|nr:hypothetical protein F3Y22_tig00111848pilonHSYRG00079 [Hibiscus syriacus]
MAGLDLGTASHYFDQLHRPDLHLHLQHKPEPEEEKASNGLVGNGCDISDCVANYARRRQRGICILCGSGAVTNVSLRQPAAAGAMLDNLFGWRARVGCRRECSMGTDDGRTCYCHSCVVTNVAYERLPLEEDDHQLQMQSSDSGGGGNNMFADSGGGAEGLSFLNLQPNGQETPVVVMVVGLIFE